MIDHKKNKKDMKNKFISFLFSQETYLKNYFFNPITSSYEIASPSLT